MMEDIDFPDIPPERRARNPLITGEGWENLKRILHHPDAPKWNYSVGDRLTAQGLAEAEVFQRELFRMRSLPSADTAWDRPAEHILRYIDERRKPIPSFRRRIPAGFNLKRDFAHIPTCSREDAALAISDFTPVNADLTGLIVYDTSGTTGHALAVPTHPLAQAKNHPMHEFVLSRYGIFPEFTPGCVACVNVGGHAQTVVFANVFSVWNQAGFAKVNLHPRDWRDTGQARRFMKYLNPVFLTGDPTGFAEMLEWDIEIRPKAMISTAVSLSPGLKAKLEAHFRCPVIDWYSLTETGPIAYSCPENRGLHILPHDIHVEVIQSDGLPAKPGEAGEIAVSGGRNPYFGLLRYLTGDFARIDRSLCPCGDPAPRLVDLAGRKLVIFRAHDGAAVNPVDAARVMRETAAFVQHEIIQRRDKSLDVAVRLFPGSPFKMEEIGNALAGLFGGVEIRIRIDENLGLDTFSGKAIPFMSELQ